MSQVATELTRGGLTRDCEMGCQFGTITATFPDGSFAGDHICPRCKGVGFQLTQAGRDVADVVYYVLRREGAIKQKGDGA